jgi:hypothetical protein
MYDYRTRYSKRVLEKVKEEFGKNVFETVIRYNIRLRETVDYGLPIGDYDKHSIGYKDYENLAEEIIRSEADTMYRGPNTLHVAQDILHKAEEYIDIVAQSPGVEQAISEIEEISPYPGKSSYPEMIKAIATEPADSVVEDESEL